MGFFIERRALGLKHDFEFGGIFRQGSISSGNAFTVIAANMYQQTDYSISARHNEYYKIMPL